MAVSDFSVSNSVVAAAAIIIIVVVVVIIIIINTIIYRILVFCADWHEIIKFIRYIFAFGDLL